MTQLVWYAAYGSNLSRARFGHYLRGGTPAGAGHAYPGCRDPSDPLEDRPWEISSELVFGGMSRTWGGGVAFVEQDPASTVKARLYLITLDQFADVVAQENWLPPGDVTVRGDLGAELDVGPEFTYGLVLPLGEIDGCPVMTFTQHRGTSPATPSAGYLRHIADGLREAHSMSDEDVVSYLGAKRGIAGEFERSELRTALVP